MPVFIPDVSEFQPNVNPGALIAGGYRAIIARLAYGNRLDRMMPQRVTQFRSAGFTVIGWYLFLRSAVSEAAQVQTVKDLLGHLGSNEFLVVDWERDTDGTLAPTAERNQTLADLTAWGGKKCWLYGPASLLRQYPAPNADPEWPASYETPDPSLPGEVMWQYTDGQYTSGGYRPVNFPGIGLCDATVYQGTFQQLLAIVGVPEPGPGPNPAPEMITNCVGAAETVTGKGYWLIDSIGRLYAHGDAAEFPTRLAAAPAVGVAGCAGGCWVADSKGALYPYGAAHGFPDSLPQTALNKPVCAIAARPQGDGLWLASQDGGVFGFGAGDFHGSAGNVRLAAPVVGIAATASGAGYWLVSSDGGVFSFGDAAFYGSMGGKALNAPVVGILSTPTGKGYWLIAADGGVFAFGDAGALGSMGGKPLNKPVVAGLHSLDGRGYALVGGDGGIFAFGDFVFSGAGA